MSTSVNWVQKHVGDMLNRLIDFVTKKKLFSNSEKILLAVSGGIDSMVMLHLFDRAGFHFAVVHCNFQLRGFESDADEKFVSEYCTTHGIIFFNRKFDTAEYINPGDYNDDIREALNELERMIGHQPSPSDCRTKAVPKPNPTPFNYSRESNTKPNADPRYNLQKQSETTINKFFGYKQTSSVSSSPNVPWEIPSAKQIKIPLLKLIYKDKLDRDLHASIPKIAELFNIPVIELRDRNSEVYKKLFANFTDSIYSLLDDKLIKLSKAQIWTITVDGRFRLRSMRAI